METYTGVKFGCVLIRCKLSGYSSEIRELIGAGKKLAALGLAHANEGNISMRVGRGFLIKATGCNLGTLGPDDFALVEGVDYEKFSVVASGLKGPSSEAVTHHMVYSVRKDAGAIAHAHNDALLAQVDSLGIPAAEPVSYGTAENARSVSELLRKSDFVAVRGHGFFSVGKTIGEAVGRFL